MTTGETWLNKDGQIKAARELSFCCQRTGGRWAIGDGVAVPLYFHSSSRGGVRKHKIFEKFFRVEVFVHDLGVVGVWIALPVHEVLQLTSSPLTSGVENGLDLVFFLAINDWRRVCKGHAISLRLLIWKEEVHVEDVVDFH